MQKLKSNQQGFGIVEIVAVILVLVLLGTGGWVVYKHNKKSASASTTTTTKATNTGHEQTTTTDPTARWKKVDSIGGAYSIRIPDGWELANYPDNTLHGDGLTYSKGTPATITTESNPYAGDQKRFNVSFSEQTTSQNLAPQWQSPNPYGNEASEDFSIGDLKGTRFSIEYTRTVTGVTKGDKLYQYEFLLPGGKGLNILYIQYAGDTDNLKLVEQAIKTIVIN